MDSPGMLTFMNRSMSLLSRCWGGFRSRSHAVVMFRTTRALTALATAAGVEISLGGCFFLLIELAILVGVILIHDLFHEFSPFGFHGSFDGSFLLIVKLTVLVCIKLFQELLLELGLAGFVRLADSLLFLLIDLTVLIGIKFLHKGGMRTWSLSTVATR